LSDSTSLFSSDRRYNLFTAVKYLTYALLSFNVYVFLAEELLAVEHTFSDGVAPGQIIQAFSASIDTASWVILLLLFELETSVLDDSRIRGWVKWALHGIRGICYLAIGYAFTGYLSELKMMTSVTQMSGVDYCALVAQDWSLLLDLDDYMPLDADNCVGLAAEAFRIDGLNIVADPDVLRGAQYLAQIIYSTRYVKYTLYAILFGAAAYWGVKGSFIDFWDASLWLFAFIFIELNVFEWQNETRQQTKAGA
jgi:hypothetical protein